MTAETLLVSIDFWVFDFAMRRFESSYPSQPVRSSLCDFRVCENRGHSRGLGWRAGVSSRHILEFQVRTGGFVEPVSARHFPISVSACPRPVRYVTETGLPRAARATSGCPGHIRSRARCTIAFDANVVRTNACDGSSKRSDVNKPRQQRSPLGRNFAT